MTLWTGHGKKIDEDKQELKMERQNLDCERNRVENEKKNSVGT